MAAKRKEKVIGTYGVKSKSGRARRRLTKRKHPKHEDPSGLKETWDLRAKKRRNVTSPPFKRKRKK